MQPNRLLQVMRPRGSALLRMRGPRFAEDRTWSGFWRRHGMMALPPFGRTRVFPSMLQRGAEVGTALLVEYYEELPEPQGIHIKAWEGRIRVALEKFKRKVA